jgi:uncharacterized protein with HEPN domain
MHNVSHKDFSCLISILDSIEKIINYTEKFDNPDDFYNDTISFDATMMNFIVIGEMAKKLSEEFKDNTREKIDWYNVKAFRNIVAHNYFGIDAEEVWQIIGESMMALQKNIKQIIE